MTNNQSEDGRPKLSILQSARAEGYREAHSQSNEAAYYDGYEKALNEAVEERAHATKWWFRFGIFFGVALSALFKVLSP